MRAKNRTRLQIEANRLDLEMYRIVGRIEEFGKTVNNKNIKSAASDLGACRNYVRAHMHPKDREETANA